MPIPHLLLVNLLLGSLCAWSGRSVVRLASRSAIVSPYFATLLLGELFLMVPLGSYLYLFYPDWSWAYLVSAPRVPSAVVVLVLLGYPLAAVSGYLGAVAACRAGQDRVVMSALGTGTGIVLIAILLTWGRIGAVGTYEQYHRAFGLRALHSSGLGAFLLASLVGLGFAWTFALVRLRRDLG